jgi:hypothetical protein
MTGSGRGRRRDEKQYEICVGGHLGDTLRCAFPGMEAQTRGADTVLSGVLADQAALFGATRADRGTWPRADRGPPPAASLMTGINGYQR